MRGDRYALLVATGAYDSPQLRALRSPVQDAAGLAAVLGDPHIGGFTVEKLVDAPSYRVTRALEGFFRDRGRDDVLLLYLSCHGIKDDDGQLYFAARDTDKDLPASTAVPAGFVHTQMERCRARSIVVLLDCCYSGSFIAGAKGDDQVHVRDELAGHGRAILTATNRTEYAWEGRSLEALAVEPSRFTGAVIDGLSSGAADVNRDGRITVTDLYDYVYDAVRRSGAKQSPRMWADLEYQVVIARARMPADRGRGSAGAQDADVYIVSAFDTGSPAPRVGGQRVQRGGDAVILRSYSLRSIAFGAVDMIVVDTAVVCPTCGGGGVTPGRSSNVCVECAGHGRVRAHRTLNFKVPAGVEGGTRIRLAGEGEVGPGGGPPGDLYIEVAEIPDDRFTRRGDDVHCVERISREAAAKLRIPRLETLDGPKPVNLPAGVRSGQTIRVRQLGIPNLDTKKRGDLLVTLDIED